MSAEPKSVYLVDPQGNKALASHPADVINLCYGQGYKVDGKQTPEEAATFLAEKGPAAEHILATQAVETKTAK